MSDVKRCPCRGSNEMCGCQNGPHPVRQDPEAEITALRARLEAVEKERDNETINRASWELEARTAQAALSTARRVADDAIKMCEDGYPVSAYNVALQVVRALADEAET